MCLFRNAILGAAAGGVLTDSSRDKTEPRILSSNHQAAPPAPPAPAPAPAPAGMKESARRPVRRVSESGAQQQQRETIWQFFEEGNKKGTCR